MKRWFCALLLSCLLLAVPVAAQQQLSREQINELLDKEGCVNLGVKLCKYDFAFEGKNVEALTFQPTGAGKFPGLLLIPGHGRTARDYSLLGNLFAREGFACIAVSQPGYGKSDGPPDFVGPMTIKTLGAAYRKFQREPYVDTQRMGVYGYSRGGMAASLLAVQLDDVRAVVLGAGVYDFQKAYDEITIEGIRANMKQETGLTAEAIKERSSILAMEKLPCPVLILHGEKDINVPVSQALLLRDRLTALKKDFEIKLFPDKDHSLGNDATTSALDFLKRRLASAQTTNSEPVKDWPKDWIDQWQMATGQLLGVAEAMPAEKYDYKPVKEVEPFGEQIKHTVLAMRVLLANAQGQKADLTKLFAELSKLKTKDQIVAEFRKATEEGGKVLAQIAGKNDGEAVESQFFGKTTRRFLLMQAIAHFNNHYGQLVVHLRLNGFAPPSSRR